MQHHKLFDDKADLYASSRPTYPKEIYNYLSSLCSSTLTAWDCACGSGQVAIGLIDKFERVYATDISENQLTNAKLHPNITYKISSAENTNFGDDFFDLVCVAQALHWFNLESYWNEVHRVLKPNGVFSAWGYLWSPVDESIESVIQEYIWDIVEPYWTPQHSLLWNRYRNIDFPFRKIESPVFKMNMLLSIDELFNLIHTTSAARRYMDDHGDDFFREAYTAVSEIWGSLIQKRKIAFSLIFYAGRSR